MFNNIYNTNINNLNTFAVFKADEVYDKLKNKQSKIEAEKKRQLAKVRQEVDEIKDKSWADIDDSSSDDKDLMSFDDDDSSEESEENFNPICTIDIQKTQPNIKSNDDSFDLNFTTTTDKHNYVATPIRTSNTNTNRQQLGKKKLTNLRKADDSNNNNVTKKKKTKEEKKKAKKLYENK